MTDLRDFKYCERCAGYRPKHMFYSGLKVRLCMDCMTEEDINAGETTEE